MRLLTALFLLSLLPATLFSQKAVDSSGISNPDISAKTLEKLSNSYAALNASLNKQSLNLLLSVQKKEAILNKSLQTTDSAKARRAFANSGMEYEKLVAKLKSSPDPALSLKTYVPGIDSMQTAIGFLTKTGLPADKIQKLQAISQQLKQLQGSFQHSADIQDYITQRETQLSQYGFGDQLSGINKEAFYYQQQIAQYKTIINDQQKQEQMVLSAIKQLPAFESFWQKNSMLAQLFPVTGNEGTLLAGTGLQTNAQIGNSIQKRLGQRWTMGAPMHRNTCSNR